MAKKSIYDPFKKGAGEAPHYEVLAPARTTATAKRIQSFDERAIMQEQPPTTLGTGPRGSPERDKLPRSAGGEDKLSRRAVYDDASNLRADNRVLVRVIPEVSTANRDARSTLKLRISRDASGEQLT